MPDSARGCDYFAGWLAGMGGVIVVTPFDAIKTKQQTLDIGFKDGAHTIKRLEGNVGFFRGLALPLVVNGALNAMFFGMYGEVLDLLKFTRYKSKGTNSDEPSEGTCSSKNDTQFVSKTVPHNIGKIAEDCQQMPRCNTADCLFAGAVAGLFQLIIACPVDVIKVRQQAYGSIVGGPIQCLSGIYSLKGVKGLYKGITPMALRNIGGGMIQSFVYKTTREYSERNWTIEKNYGKWFNIWLAAGFAGMVSWWVVAPLDVIKTKMQADEHVSPKYTGLINCAHKVVASNGYLGLFRGVMSLSVPSFLVNGAIFVIYNWTDSLCRYEFSKRTN